MWILGCRSTLPACLNIDQLWMNGIWICSTHPLSLSSRGVSFSAIHEKKLSFKRISSDFVLNQRIFELFKMLFSRKVNICRKAVRWESSHFWEFIGNMNYHKKYLYLADVSRWSIRKFAKINSQIGALSKFIHELFFLFRYSNKIYGLIKGRWSQI